MAVWGEAPHETPPTKLYYHRFQFYKNPLRSTQDFSFGQFKFRGYFDFNLCPQYASSLEEKSSYLTMGIHLCEADVLQLPQPVRCIIMLVDISGKNGKDLLIRDQTYSTIDDWAKGANNTVNLNDIKHMSWKNVQLKDRGKSSRSFLCKYQLIWC